MMEKMIQLTTGRTNELWNVVGLVALASCSEVTATPADNHISRTVHYRLHGRLGLPFGTTPVHLGQERCCYLVMRLLNHIRDINLGIHEFAEFFALGCVVGSQKRGRIPEPAF